MQTGIDKYILHESETLLLRHEGPVDKEVLLQTLPRIEEILEREGACKPLKRKIINIAIETLQNLQLHSLPAEQDKFRLPPLFLLGKNKESVTITIGNLIANEEKKLLEDKLNKINSLNEDEVKFLYGVIMKQTVVKFSTKGGAGLGLIDMKKKSGRPLQYSFQNVDDNVSYFSLKVSVPYDHSDPQKRPSND